jgi:polyhydroxybutyrate depolymerase
MKKYILRTVVIIVAVLLLVSFVPASAYYKANKTNGELVSSGQNRSYLLYVPKSYNPTRPTPLIISMHGFAGWPAHQMDVSRWNALADKYGLIVVYPAGLGLPMYWRTGGFPGDETDLESDVTFISELIDTLETEYNIDPARIYADGFSNGGGMAYVLSCKLAERIAAIGIVSGTYLFPWEECSPSRPVPVIVFHGTADPVIPYEGGLPEELNIASPSIPGWTAEFSRRNGCAEKPLELPAISDVRGIQYTNCASNAEVVLYSIIDGGHSWPGIKAMIEQIAGHTTMAIDATEIMWEFFQTHPMLENQ